MSEGALVSAWTTLDSADRDLLICLPSSSVNPSAAVCGTTKDVTYHCGRLVIVNKAACLAATALEDAWQSRSGYLAASSWCTTGLHVLIRRCYITVKGV